MDKVTTPKTLTQVVPPRTPMPPPPAAPDFAPERQAGSQELLSKPTYYNKLGNDLFACVPSEVGPALIRLTTQVNMTLRGLNTLTNQLMASHQEQIDWENAEDGSEAKLTCTPLSNDALEDILANQRLLVSAAMENFERLCAALARTA